MIINYTFMLFQVCAWCIFSLWIEYSKNIYLFLEMHVTYNLDNINLYTPINFLLVSITYLFICFSFLVQFFDHSVYNMRDVGRRFKQ